MTQRTTSTGKILHNSFWYGLETIIEAVVFLGASVAVARYLGPEKLGYFSYINFFVAVVTRTSGNGIASATRKYMAEFLGQDQPGTAHALYRLAYRYQVAAALTITAVGLAGVHFFGDAQFRLMASILILSIIPAMLSWIPAQANLAFEDVANNTWSAFGYIFAYASVLGLTLYFHWDLIGVASAQLVGRSVEVVLRTLPLNAKLRTMPLGVLEHSLIQRVRKFCLEAVGIQLLMSVVWDRSELIFLRAFSGLEQIAFYSVSFTLANNLLLIPRTFGAATGMTLMVESGRDPLRVASIVKNACRYLLLVVFPVHLGAAAITAQAIAFAYTTKYLGAIPVLIIAAILSIPRAFQEIPEVLLRAADKQSRLLTWFVFAGLVNIALDWLLIPRYGAIGAAWGNGLGQSFGVICIWLQARQSYHKSFGFPVGAALRLLIAGCTMAAAAWVVVRTLPGLAGLVAAVLTAIPVYILMVRLVRGLEPSDGVRLASIATRLPGRARKVFQRVVDFAAPAR